VNANWYLFHITKQDDQWEVGLTDATSTFYFDYISPITSIYFVGLDGGGGTHYIDNFYVSEFAPEYIETAEVIDPPYDWASSSAVVMGLDYGLEYVQNTYCYIGSNVCAIHVNYSADFFGADVLLVENPVIVDVIDAELNLSDNPPWQFDLTPVMRDTAQIDLYDLYIEKASGTTTSTFAEEPLEVHWISSTTDEITAGDIVLDYIGRCFPFSVYIKIKRMIDDRVTEIQTTNRTEITINDFLAPETGLQLSTSSDAVLLSAALIVDNDPIGLWSDYIYPLIGYIMWAITGIITCVILYKALIPADTTI